MCTRQPPKLANNAYLIVRNRLQELFFELVHRQGLTSIQNLVVRFRVWFLIQEVDIAGNASGAAAIDISSGASQIKLLFRSKFRHLQYS